MISKIVKLFLLIYFYLFYIDFLTTLRSTFTDSEFNRVLGGINCEQNLYRDRDKKKDKPVSSQVTSVNNINNVALDIVNDNTSEIVSNHEDPPEEMSFSVE